MTTVVALGDMYAKLPKRQIIEIDQTSALPMGFLPDSHLHKLREMKQKKKKSRVLVICP